jgi:hypothetical protein
MEISQEAKDLVAKEGVDKALSDIGDWIWDLEMCDAWTSTQHSKWDHYCSLQEQVEEIKRLTTPHDFYAVREISGGKRWAKEDRTLSANEADAKWHSDRRYAEVVREDLNQAAGNLAFEIVIEKKTEEVK